MSRSIFGAALSAAIVSTFVPGARADGLELAPVGTLPPTPTTASLWFDGADPDALSDLLARQTHPRTAAYFTAFKAYVDARLTTIGSADG